MACRILTIYCVLPAAWCLMLAGCGGQEGSERVVVSGTVTYRGEPLDDGEIRFLPIKGTKAPMSGAKIIDGQYAVEARGGVATQVVRYSLGHGPFHGDVSQNKAIRQGNTGGPAVRRSAAGP